MSDASAIPAKVAKVIRLIRQKKRDVITAFHQSERCLLQAFDLDPKEKITEKAQRHLKLKQENEAFQQALSSLDIIQSRIAEFLSETPPDDLEQRYNQLCTLQPIISMFELDDLVTNRPPKAKLPVREYEMLDEKTAGPYCKKFAEVKGSTQGMTERLRRLFPPPKTKPILFSPPKPAEE
jgi:hypothetical protein